MLEQPESPHSHLLRPVETQIMGILLPTLDAACQRMFDIGMEEAPKEACGILVREFEGFRVHQLTNRAEDPTRSFRIDADTLRQLALKPKTWTNVAVWHTHPGGLVGPSPGDLEHKVHHVKYIVVTIPTGEVREF